MARAKPVLPARWRIIAWITAVMAAGLASVVVVVHASLHAAVNQQANDHVSSALIEFQNYADKASSSPSGPPMTTEDLLEAYLQVRHPSRGELMLGLLETSPLVLINSGPDVPDGFSLDADPGLRATLLSQSSGTADTPHGPIRWASRRCRPNTVSEVISW